MYEPGITYLIQQCLSNYPEALFMDLGANIGYYSLLAARSGHKTIAGTVELSFAMTGNWACL